MDIFIVTGLQAAIRGFLLRRSLIWDVRKEFMTVVKELEPDLPDGAVTWNSNLSISFPNFRPATHVVKAESIKQSNRRKFHKKVKTCSTQTEPQLQAASRPGMRYMETSPGKELFDSFSSLSSVNCTVSPQQVAPKEQVTDLIDSLTMETTKKHLTGTNTQHGDRKKQKNKKTRHKEKLTDHNASLSSIARDHERLKDNTLMQSDSSLHVSSTHCTPAVARQLQHSSLHLTSTPSNDTLLSNVQSRSIGDIVTHPTHKQPHSSDTMIHRTQEQPHSDDIVTHHTQEQPHSGGIVTHHTQEQPHSGDIVTHHTQEQPHSSDIVTYHTQEQSRIVQQVKRWSKFEQLKAKYLLQSTPCSVTLDNHKKLQGFKMRN